MMTSYRISQAQLRKTFTVLRSCGNKVRECQVIWISPWDAPHAITDVIHPIHSATASGFDVDKAWLTFFWKWLGERRSGVRVQVHTHPGRAYHSRVDDHWPMIHTSGFLSLVIPRFATGPVGFKGAHLAELDSDGHWRTVNSLRRLEVVP